MYWTIGVLGVISIAILASAYYEIRQMEKPYEKNDEYYKRK